MIEREQAKLNLAYHVKARLLRMGRTRYWLAKEMGTSESQIQKVVEGKTVPNWVFVTNLAEVLGVTVQYFQEPPPREVLNSGKVSTKSA